MQICHLKYLLIPGRYYREFRIIIRNCHFVADLLYLYEQLNSLLDTAYLLFREAKPATGKECNEEVTNK